jgi:hypothetical protein
MMNSLRREDAGGGRFFYHGFLNFGIDPLYFFIVPGSSPGGRIIFFCLCLMGKEFRFRFTSLCVFVLAVLFLDNYIYIFF